MVSTQGERLVELQKAAGYETLADLARAAGIEPGTARQQVSRNSIPSNVALKYIEAARKQGARASAEWLLYGNGHMLSRIPDLPQRMEPSELSPPVTKLIQEPQMSGAPDVPVWASAEGGMDGAIILTPDPVDYVRRSERMLAVKSPFAFIVVGDSMSPAIGHGDTVVLNPALKPKIGDDCVFIQERGDGTFLALIKRIHRAPTAEHWHVRQFTPAEDFKLPRKTWPKVYVVDEIRRGH